MQCAVLLGKLKRFDWEVQRRIELGGQYAERIQASGAVAQLLTIRPDRSSVWAQYTVVVEDRDGVQSRMKSVGVPTAIHYPKSLHQQPAYSALCAPGRFPVSEHLADRVLSLPMSADLTDEQMTRVVAALAAATRT